jgi:hypothetical protein
VVTPEFRISLEQSLDLEFRARTRRESRQEGQEASYPMAHEPEGLRIWYSFEGCASGPRGLAEIVVDFQYC